MNKSLFRQLAVILARLPKAEGAITLLEQLEADSLELDKVSSKTITDMTVKAKVDAKALEKALKDVKESGDAITNMKTEQFKTLVGTKLSELTGRLPKKDARISLVSEAYKAGAIAAGAEGLEDYHKKFIVTHKSVLNTAPVPGGDTGGDAGGDDTGGGTGMDTKLAKGLNKSIMADVFGLPDKEG